jgi:chromosome segregation ATPase
MTIDGGRVVVRLEGKDVNLGQLITKIEREMKGAQATVGQFDGTLARLTATTKRTESETLAYAQALARTDIAAGRYSQGIQRLAAAITQITPNTVAGANAIANLQNQISKYEKQAAAAEARSKSFATGVASSFNQLIGASFAVTAVVSSISAVVDAGNRLEKIDATVRALSGSQEKYNEVLGIAKQQQALYGGSLEENLTNLSGFIYTANQAGVSVDKLANIARRLAIIDPVQG